MLDMFVQHSVRGVQLRARDADMDTADCRHDPPILDDMFCIVDACVNVVRLQKTAANPGFAYCSASA